MRICQDYKPDDIFIAGFVCKLFSQERHGRFDAISSDIELMFSSAESARTWSGRNADRYPQPPKPATVVPTWAALLLDDSPFEKLPISEIRKHPIETQAARPTKPNRICLEALPVLKQHRSLPNKEQLPTAKFKHVFLLKALGETTHVRPCAPKAALLQVSIACRPRFSMLRRLKSANFGIASAELF